MLLSHGFSARIFRRQSRSSSSLMLGWFFRQPLQSLERVQEILFDQLGRDQPQVGIRCEPGPFVPGDTGPCVVRDEEDLTPELDADGALNSVVAKQSWLFSGGEGQRSKPETVAGPAPHIRCGGRSYLERGVDLRPPTLPALGAVEKGEDSLRRSANDDRTFDAPDSQILYAEKAITEATTAPTSISIKMRLVIRIGGRGAGVAYAIRVPPPRFKSELRHHRAWIGAGAPGLSRARLATPESSTPRSVTSGSCCSAP